MNIFSRRFLGIYAIIFFALVFGVFNFQNVQAAGKAVFSFSTEKKQYEPGKIFKVDIKFDSKGESVDVAQVDLASTNLEFVKIFHSSLFANEVSPSNAFNGKDGRATNVRFVFPPAYPKAGLFATLEVKGKAKGNAELRLTSETHALAAGEEKIDPTKLNVLEIGIGQPYKKVAAPVVKPAPAPVLSMPGLPAGAVHIRDLKELKLLKKGEKVWKDQKTKKLYKVTEKALKEWEKAQKAAPVKEAPKVEAPKVEPAPAPVVEITGLPLGAVYLKSLSELKGLKPGELFKNQVNGKLYKVAIRALQEFLISQNKGPIAKKLKDLGLEPIICSSKS